MEINLDNPIFAMYVNVSGYARAKAEEICLHYQAVFKQFSNITVWLIETKDETRIECIFKGKYEKNMFVEKIKEVIDTLDDDTLTHTDIKAKLRDVIINEILN